MGTTIPASQMTVNLHNAYGMTNKLVYDFNILLDSEATFVGYNDCATN